MKKLFFCLFSTIFIALCLWLGMYGETYATFVTGEGVTFTNTIVVNDNDPQTILTALSSFDFSYNNTTYLEWSDISSIDYIFYQGYFNYPDYNKADCVIDAFPQGATISYSSEWNGNYYYSFSSTPYVHIQLNNRTSSNNQYPITLHVTYWYKPNGDWYSYPLPNNEYHRLLSNFDFTYTPPNENPVDFDGSLGSSGGGNEEEEDKTLLETIQDFFGDFWDNILHIVVPTDEQWEDIIDNFRDNILSKFTITNIARYSTYDNTNLYPIEYQDEMPVFYIYGYYFDTKMVAEFMQTPITFGQLRRYSGNSTTLHSIDINTGGLTPFTLINILFGINIAVFNIVLYNKFFEKE